MKQNFLALLRDAANKIERLVDLADRLLQVNDVNPIALRKNVLRHLRIPPTRLMTEVDARFQ